MNSVEKSFEPESGLVVMTCGVFAQELEAKGFNRLSIDEEIWANFGRFGIDYPETDYGKYQTLARDIVERKLLANLKSKVATVLDLSFWNKKERYRMSELIALYGGRHQLVYLKVPEEVLKARLKERSKRFDANAAFTITDEMYFNGFQEPKGENEIVIEVQ